MDIKRKPKTDAELAASPWPKDKKELKRRMMLRLRKCLGDATDDLIIDERNWLIEKHPSEDELLEYRRIRVEAPIEEPEKVAADSNYPRLKSNSWLREHLKETRTQSRAHSTNDAQTGDLREAIQ